MMRRLWKSDELIKQLKHIVKAQHGKIEELRERLEFEPAGMVRAQMAAQDMTNFTRVKEDNEELRRHVHRVKGELEKVKSECDTLRRANNRLKRMVTQSPSHLPQVSPREDSDDPCTPRSLGFGGMDANVSSGMGDTVRSAPAEVGSHHHHQPSRQSEMWHGSGAPGPLGTSKSTGSSPVKRPVTSGAAAPAALPAFSKLWRLSSVIPMFWRDLRSPACVLNTLVEISRRLLEDGPSTSITIYMLDSWLRAAASDKDDQPALFYLGSGRTTVQVFRTDGARAEAPRFQDLQALPTHTRTALAVAVQMPSAHRKMAMLQVVANTEEPEKKHSPVKRPPKELQDKMMQQPTENQAGFTDAHLMYLQMVCNVAGGIMEQLKDAEKKSKLLDRMRSCVDVTVAINQARSLPDFEQRVKHLLGNFFAVNTVRVLFYEIDTDELLISSAQMRRKGLSRLGLDKGVVGLCAKKQQVVHVANISHHPYIDAAADGLQRSGRPISSESSMLVGPLVIENVEGPRLVGVVQLLERRKVKDTEREAQSEKKGEEFSQEEQSLFTQLLRVCAQAAWRTYLVQELTGKVNDTPMSLAHMLSQ